MSDTVAVATPARRVPRQRLPGRRRHRLGHRRPAALPGQHRARALRERRGHGGRALRHHLDVRTGLGRPLQPGRLLRRRRLRGPQVARRRRLPARPDARLHRRGDRGQPHVLQGRRLHLDQAPGLRAHFLSEVVATVGLMLVIFALARTGRSAPRPGRRRRLHRRRLLLHQLDQLRQPGHHRRPHVLQHLRRHRPLVGPELHRRPGRRRRPRLRR